MKKWCIATLMVLFVALGLPVQACRGGDEDRGDEGATRIGSIAELPAPVRQAFGHFAPQGARAEDIESEMENGLKTFSAEFDSKQGDQEVTVLEDGTLVDIETEMKPKKLSPEIAALASKLLGAEPEEADHVRLAVYEIEDRLPGGEIRERYVDPFGRILIEKTHKVQAEKDVAVGMDELSSRVRETILSETGGAEILRLQQEEEWGHRVFSAAWRTPEGRREVKVLENGNVLYLEMPLGVLPAKISAMVGEGDVDEAGDVDAEDSVGEAEEEDENESVEEAREEDGNKGAEADEENDVQVERMLLDCWEFVGRRGSGEVEGSILSSGEVLREAVAVD